MMCAMQSGNLLSGATSDIYPSGPELNVVYLNDNLLSSKFPFLLTSPRLSVYDVSGNKISGPMTSTFSTSFAAVTSLSYYTKFLALDASNGMSLELIFHSNQLTGSLPEWVASFPSSV